MAWLVFALAWVHNLQLPLKGAAHLLLVAQLLSNQLLCAVLHRALGLIPLPCEARHLRITCLSNGLRAW